MIVSIHPSTHLSLCPSMYPPVCLSCSYASISRSIRLPIYPAIICVCVPLSAHPSVRPSIPTSEPTPPGPHPHRHACAYKHTRTLHLKISPFTTETTVLWVWKTKGRHAGGKEGGEVHPPSRHRRPAGLGRLPWQQAGRASCSRLDRPPAPAPSGRPRAHQPRLLKCVRKHYRDAKAGAAESHKFPANQALGGSRGGRGRRGRRVRGGRRGMLGSGLRQPVRPGDQPSVLCCGPARRPRAPGPARPASRPHGLSRPPHQTLGGRREGGGV